MNKLLILFTLLLTQVGTLFAQVRPEDDFPLDDSVAYTVESVEIFGSPASEKASPKKASVRARIPAVGNMGVAPAGETLGWAIGYYATTMLYDLKPTDVLSPYFLFDMLTKANDKCRLPTALYMEELKKILLQTGCLRTIDYPRRGNCTVKPPRAVYEKKIRYPAVLNTVLAAKTGQGLSNAEIRYAIHRKINAGTPVIGILRADVTFRNLKTEVWTPTQNPNLTTQALLIVGYDDNEEVVEVVNCLGSNWGKGGYAKIRYQDLYHFRQLFQLSKPSGQVLVQATSTPPRVNQPASTKPSSTPSRQVTKPTPPTVAPNPGPQSVPTQLAGTIRLRIPAGTDQYENILFENVQGTYTNGLFDASSWPIRQQFQLTVDQLTPQTYLYLFSVDGAGKASIHWPQRTSLGNLADRPYSALVSDRETSFMLPRPRRIAEGSFTQWQERVFIKDEAGTDYLVVLHSAKELDDQEFLDIVESMKGQYTSTDFMNRLRSSLGKRLVLGQGPKGETNQIRYEEKS
ncbi:MAG: hypothetical protein KKG00_11085, partial [Bacteroidetes bacterium]|nr:hypothetical protein [Bacteroidota bacterium]